MRKITLGLAIAVSCLTYSQKCLASDFQQLISGKQAPLTKQLQDLNDSWRQVAISGQYEMADFMKSWTNLFGIDSYNNIYYTQGKTVKINHENYVVAYRLPASDKTLNIQSLFENLLNNAMMGSMASLTNTDCDSIVSSAKITPETNIQLSLLNLKTIGSLNDVRPFDLQTELARSEKFEQQSKETCELAKLEAINLQVDSNLSSLGVALHSYAEQNSGELPDMSNFESVQQALQDFVYDQSIFYHPETLEPYLANASLSAKNLADLDPEQEIVAFYEPQPAADGTIGVVYVDGLCQRIAPEDWEKVKETSELP
jgi:hypothetical protein